MEKLKWISVEYTIKELLKPGGSVVVQRDILERWKADNPGREIKAHAGFKCNQQDFTVSIRIGVVDNTKWNAGTVAKLTFTGADGSKIEGEQAEDGVRGNSAPVTDSPKLLQPGYDELKEKYDAMAGAVIRDAQKFSAVLIENENLKKLILDIKIFIGTDDCDWHEFARIYEKIDKILAEQEIYLFPEDATDLTDAKEVIKNDEDTVPFNAADFQDVDLSPKTEENDVQA